MIATIRAVPAIATLALRPLPLGPLDLLLSIMLDAVIQQHPDIFDRIGAHAGKRFGIDPTDMPFAIVLAPWPDAPRIVAVRNLDRERLDARIAGPLAALCGLAGGTLDGDALFFSRDLAIEGDVEAILALRNAIDDAEVDLVRAAGSCLGPLGPAFGQAARIARSVLAPLTRTREWS